MTQPDLARTVGLRDRAILELLYSTGLRRTELIRLELGDIDCEHQTLLVRQPKGRRDRRIPIGSRAAAWLAKYLADVRPELVTDPSQRSVFLTREGFPLVPDHLTKMVHDYVQAAGIGKHGSCHMFRHTMATLMLEGGADIRFIQQMLGHAVLSTTQIYTQVSMRQLQRVHALTHPAERGRSERLTAGQESGTALPEILSPFDADAGEEPF
jgi:integrase/recombinase XerD